MHAIHPTRRHAAQLLLPGRPLLPTDLYSSRLLVLGDDDGRSGEVIGAGSPAGCNASDEEEDRSCHSSGAHSWSWTDDMGHSGLCRTRIYICTNAIRLLTAQLAFRQNMHINNC